MYEAKIVWNNFENLDRSIDDAITPLNWKLLPSNVLEIAIVVALLV